MVRYDADSGWYPRGFVDEHQRRSVLHTRDPRWTRLFLRQRCLDCSCSTTAAWTRLKWRCVAESSQGEDTQSQACCESAKGSKVQLGIHWAICELHVCHVQDKAWTISTLPWNMPMHPLHPLHCRICPRWGFGKPVLPWSNDKGAHRRS